MDLPEQNRARIEIEVCKQPGMSAAHWATLSRGQQLPWLEQTIEALAAESKTAADPDDLTARTSVDARALALFLVDKTRTETAIAKLLGCATQNLEPKRCPQLSHAMAAWKATEPDRRKVLGSKDKDGN